MLQAPPLNPARDYAAALGRARAIQARDGDAIAPPAGTLLLTHGAKAERCVVLFHGFTNHPGQFRTFAPMLHARGVNVFVPRLPGHGCANRMTTALATLTAEEVLTSASEAIDVASGLGNRVALLGISLGGALCGFFAQHRAGIERAVCISPPFGILRLSYWGGRAMLTAALVLPNAFLWWDPKVKERLPGTAYPRYPTRGLAQSLRIANAVHDAARRAAPAAPAVVLAANARDPLVDLRTIERVASWWNDRRSGSAQLVAFPDLPVNHDIVDPDNPRARTDLVYPKLLDLVFGS